jgi:hypothetical protein
MSTTDGGVMPAEEYYALQGFKNAVAAAVDRAVRPFRKALINGVAVQLASRQARRPTAATRPVEKARRPAVTKSFDAVHDPRPGCACASEVMYGECRCR